MSVQEHDRETAREQAVYGQGARQRGKEMLVFLAASLVGIFGLGQGLAGLYERGQQISLLWLAVTGLAFFVLFAQMGRVHDSWPRRPDKTAAPTSNTPVSPGDAAPGLDQSK